ncbi:hypothetical protein B0J11DRAFT_586082 [Dendryphion nanum]|uniref:Uncharacterized protein n=1 Tax=Dendryphion nanum TaxID=256645 RepID=A0A9P9D039_9PLEO|nr:hypothetical protein B0J11DRAFT_586082 [Dendryphion nanum]
MTHQLLEAVIPRGKRKFKYRPSPGCLGKEIGRLDRASRCWAAKGSVREEFYTYNQKEILTHLGDWYGSDDWLTLSIYMIGTSDKTASPIVLFISENSEERKEARRIIKESGMLEKYPGYKTAHASKDPGCEKLEELGSSHFESDVSSDRVPAMRVLRDRRNTLLSIGMPIYISHGSTLHAATSNAIVIQGQMFYLAPCHTFFPKLQKQNPNIPVFGSDFEIDSDDDVDETGDEVEESEDEVSRTSIPEQASSSFGGDAYNSIDDMSKVSDRTYPISPSSRHTDAYTEFTPASSRLSEDSIISGKTEQTR